MFPADFSYLTKSPAKLLKMLEFRIHSTAGFQPTAIIVKTNGELQFGVIATRGWICMRIKGIKFKSFWDILDLKINLEFHLVL